MLKTKTIQRNGALQQQQQQLRTQLEKETRRRAAVNYRYCSRKLQEEDQKFFLLKTKRQLQFSRITEAAIITKL